MTSATVYTHTQALTLPEELILMLLNEESGFFHQVPGWNLNCTVVGAVLAELSLMGRIDTDQQSLFVVNNRPTGNPTLDPVLQEIAGESTRRNTQYWIERLSPRADTVIEQTLDRLVDLKILEHHDGEFWTLSRSAFQAQLGNTPAPVATAEFVRPRISKVILNDDIPSPRDVIIIALIDTCDIFRFMFPLDEETEQRIKDICRMELIARSLADAVSQSMAGPLLRRAAFTRKVPKVNLLKVLFNKNFRAGNYPALFADLAKVYGPVFAMKLPFKPAMYFLAGMDTNRWVHRQGRMYLRAKDYFAEFEKVYGANGVLPSLDGAEHFRMRKAMAPAFSRARLEGQLDILLRAARKHMAEWKVGQTLRATDMCRMLVNAQLSTLFLNVDSQDLLEDLAKYKERALLVHIAKLLPKFMLHTPDMRRRAKVVDVLLERVQSVHTAAQRAGAPRDLADDWLSLHASEPQFVPETTLRFQLAAALIASVYLGDALSFALYVLVTRPDLLAEIRREADALFDNGDPTAEDITLASVDVTHRFLMESLRLYPVVPTSLRHVMNTCVVEDFELPTGSQLLIAASATHYMDDVFPNATEFDIDRYQPPRNEHHSSGYAPFGLGTHTCLGSRWMELQMAVNLLMLARHFTLEVNPRNYKLTINPIPSAKPSKKLKFRITERRREFPVGDAAAAEEEEAPVG